jgi:DNA-binding winged helix-turn-helix (wHTH) protein/tetratricopeptide (TPR) repeat protein
MPTGGADQNVEWRFGPFVLNRAASELIRDGTPVAIEPQSMRLLVYLIENGHRVVSREDLIEAVWQGRAISDWTVSGAVKALRVALGDTGKTKQFVKTVHSRGFRFIAEIQATTYSAAPAVFVRQFRTPGEAAEDLYLAEGLTEDLITDLSRQKTLRVLSYNTTRALGDAQVPASLEVQAIVEGSLRRVGETIRVNVAILAPNGADQLWAERFDLTVASLLAGQDRIGRRVAETLAPGPRAPSLRHGGTRDPLAYDHYLKGRYAYFRYDPSSFAEALSHFERAAELDPGFADAFAQQAYCRTSLFVFALLGGDETLDRAERLARQAIALDDGSPLGHARLGWVLGYRGQPDACIAAFEAAVTRSGNSAEAYHSYGETMNRLAQPSVAEPLLERAFALDAYFPPSWEFASGHTQVLLRAHDRAITHFQSVLSRVARFVPARVQLARTLWEAGRQTEAAEMIAALREIAPRYGLAQAERMFPYPVPSERARLLSALKAAGLS